MRLRPLQIDHTRKEESPKQFAALDHSKQQNGEPKNRDQLNYHLQTANLGAASLSMSSQPRFGVEGLDESGTALPLLIEISGRRRKSNFTSVRK